MTEIELTHQLSYAIIISYSIEKLKQWNWFPYLSHHSETANKAVAYVLAVFTGIGVHYSATGDISTGGTITFTIPALNVILENILHVATQIGLQNGCYRVLIKKDQV